jgi:hypothetical protein
MQFRWLCRLHGIQKVGFRVNVIINHLSFTPITFNLHILAKSYWARDLIFLFVDGRDPQVATLAWLQAYNGIDTGRYLWAEPLTGHSGAIIGGMVLDLSVPRFTHLQLQYIGVSKIYIDLF